MLCKVKLLLFLMLLDKSARKICEKIVREQLQSEEEIEYLYYL